MKSFLFFFGPSIIASMFILGCNTDSLPAPTAGAADPSASLSVETVEFRGNHLLHQVVTQQTISGYSSGSYFLFTGGMSGSVSTDTTVTFSWEGNDGVYRYSSLPITKIRVEMNPKFIKPFVKFRWRDDCFFIEPHDNCIEYAQVGVNPKDWPEQIQMPLTTEKK